MTLSNVGIGDQNWLKPTVTRRAEEPQLRLWSGSGILGALWELYFVPEGQERSR